LTAGAAEIRVANRSAERARLLAAAFGAGVRAVAWAARESALADISLLVNCTTLGMRGQPPLILDLAALPDEAVVCDIVYTPLETPLLAAAARRGLAVVDGLGMLLHQARPGFARWFGTTPEVTDDLRAHVLAGLAEA
jgi:shikimate dehydrogenase